MKKQGKQIILIKKTRTPFSYSKSGKQVVTIDEGANRIASTCSEKQKPLFYMISWLINWLSLALLPFYTLLWHYQPISYFSAAQN